MASLCFCFVFFRITHSSSDQKWRKWTLPAGCVKLWASTSQALPPAALSKKGRYCPDIHINTQHLTRTQAITHIGTFFFICSWVLKKKKSAPLTQFHLFVHQQQGPLSRCAAAGPQLHHASVESSSCFHKTTD